MDEKLLNEEEIKNKILLPYLNDLGFSIKDINFESSFTIKLGKKRHSIKNDVSKGYLDILCKKDDMNLFVIEVKRESIIITQDDIDQGISYARLLNNIAPFVVITNGKDTKIIDTISKKDLSGKKINESSEFWKNKCILALNEDLKYRYEALKCFVSMNAENFKIFSKEQVTLNINPIVSNPSSKNAKYNEELFIPRKGLTTEFNNFLLSDKNVFAIVGDAGVGKTNAICDLCINSPDNFFSLFYLAPLINQSLVSEIVNDFNMFFSSKSLLENIISELNSICDRFNKPLVIFIDAIDESQLSNFRLELGNFAKYIQGSHLKLCLTCKSSIWSDFIYIGNNHSYLSSSIYQSENKDFKNYKLPGLYLNAFSYDELKQIIPKYKEYFSVKGSIPSIVEKSITNGFLLRILFERFKNNKITYNEIDFDFLELYLDSKAKASHVSKNKLIKVLYLVAKLTLSKDQDKFFLKEELITIRDIEKELNLSPLEDLPEWLFSQNILLKSMDDDTVIVSFYESTVRDFILTKYVYNFDSMEEKALLNYLPLFFNGFVGQSAIKFYLSSKKSKKRYIINNFINSKIQIYVSKYTEILDNFFPAIRNTFEPFTNNYIGMYYSNDNGSFIYALFSSDEKIIEKRVIEVNKSLFALDNHSFFIENKISTTHFGALSIFKNNLHDSIKNNLFKQLIKNIREKLIDESNSLLLVSEKVLNIVYFYTRELGFDIRPKNNKFPNYQEIYSIDFLDLKKRIIIYFAEKYYKNENINYLIKSGIIKKSGNGYSFSNDQLSWSWINKQVDNAIKNKFKIPDKDGRGHVPPFVYLNNLIDILMKCGYEKIQDLDYMPLINQMIIKKDIINHKQNYYLKQGSVKIIIENYFYLFEKAYKELVDASFPIIKNDFKFYKTIPHQYIIYSEKLEERLNTIISFGYKKSNTDKINFIWNSEKYNINDYRKYEFETIYKRTLDSLLYVISDSVMLKGVNTHKVNSHLIIREMVYKMLELDIESYCIKNDIDINI